MTFSHDFHLVTRLKLNSEASSRLNALDLAAVHTHGGAGHPPRRGRDEISQQVSNLLRLSKARDSRFLWELPDCLFHGKIVRGRPLFKEGPPATCHHSARYDAVDLYPVFDSLLGKCLSECKDGRVNRRDGGKFRF